MTNSIKYLVASIKVTIILVAFLLPITTFAEENNTTTSTVKVEVKKTETTFPISELGNCTDIPSCKIYCEDAANKTACSSFGLKKGLVKKPVASLADSELLSRAKNDLGCSTKEECQKFCSEAENWEKCGEFARRYRLSSLQKIETKKIEVMAKAKAILNCNNLDECKKLCDLRENQVNCRRLAEVTGLSSKPKNTVTDIQRRCLEMKQTLEKNGTLPPAVSEQFKRYCQEKVTTQPKMDGNVMVALEYCKRNPVKCQNLVQNSSKIMECSQKPGCYYSSETNSCKCDASNTGGDFNNYSQMIEEYSQICQEKQCTWSKTNCTCNSPDVKKDNVQGVSTKPTLLQSVLNFF